METTSTPVPKFNATAMLHKIDCAARRALDILASALGLALLSPFFLVIAIRIRHDSPGPVFYFGPRLGLHGKRFGIVKFRTMYERKESYAGPRITATGDTRITPFGRWLRDTKVNELPQLWNVLKGDMSLVGPRPEDPEIAKAWPPALRDDLLSVRPGITSPATVVFRHEENLLNTTTLLDDYLKIILPDKLRLDRNYVRSRNLLTDLDVIFMTVLLLLPRLRQIQVPETALYWGPIARFVSRNLNWFAIDTLTALLAIGLSAAIWRLSAPFNIGLMSWIWISAAVGLTFSFINAGLGLTRITWRRAPARQVIPLAFSSLCTTLMLILVDNLFLPHIHLPAPMLAIAGTFSFSGFAFTRYRERLLTGLASSWLDLRGSQNSVGERVLVVGAGENSQLVIWFLTHSEFARMFTIVGIVDDDPRKQGMMFDGYRVLGTSRELPALTRKHHAGLTIFTITNIDLVERRRILEACQETDSRLLVFPDVMDELGRYFLAAERRRTAEPQAMYSSVTGD